MGCQRLVLPEVKWGREGLHGNEEAAGVQWQEGRSAAPASLKVKIVGRETAREDNSIHANGTAGNRAARQCPAVVPASRRRRK